MKHYDLNTIPQFPNRAVTVGKFDGIHRGHQELLRVLRENAPDLPIAVLKIVPDNGETPTILTEEESDYILKNFGVDAVVTVPLTDSIRQMRPEEFVTEILIKKFRCTVLAVGDDFRFGRNRSGTAEWLRQESSRFGLQTFVCTMEYCKNEMISSTSVRELLMQSDLQAVTDSLGFPYFIMGTVIRGKQLGRTISFPTINLIPEKRKLLPPIGVYETETELNGIRYASVTNIGTNPSVKDNVPHAVTVETHILGFSGDCYGETAIVRFVRKLREQISFGALDELKEQLCRDIENVKKRNG